MSKKEPCIIVDLDGTLCELTDDPYNHTWEEKPIYSMIHTLEREWYPLNIDIFILTGRKEKYRAMTEKWLFENAIEYDKIIMQEKSMADKNHVYKEEKLLEIKKKYDIRMVYDDNFKVWEVCARLKIPFYPCY